MTEEEATEILDHLIQEFENTGYGIISEIAVAKLEESSNGKNGNNIYESQRAFLKAFLTQSAEILGAISSHSLGKDIQTINQSLQVGRIEEVEMELSNGRTFNLKELPNYQQVITMLQGISEQISNE